MHAVIRQKQGIPWTKEQPKGMKANLEHLASGRVEPNVPVAADTLQLAYGAGMAPKLVAEVSSPLLALRQKALIQVIKAMSAPRELASLLVAGLVPALNAAAAADDDMVRSSANLALAQAAGYPGGQRAMLATSSVDRLVGGASPIVCDANEAVRAHALRAVLELGKNPDGCRALIDASAVQLLIARVSAEAPLLQGLALMALQQLMTQKAGLADSIREGGLGVLIPLLSSEERLAREKAALALVALTTGLAEKLAAGPSALPPLIAMLRDEAPSARHAASSALMSITVDKDVKEMAVSAGVGPALGAALDECVANELQPEEVRDLLVAALTVNLLQTINQMAEYPKARSYFKAKGALQKLMTLEQSSNEHVKKHAAKAVAQVTWMP